MLFKLCFQFLFEKKMLWCDIDIKIVFNVSCFRLFINNFVLKWKKKRKKKERKRLSKQSNATIIFHKKIPPTKWHYLTLLLWGSDYMIEINSPLFFSFFFSFFWWVLAMNFVGNNEMRLSSLGLFLKLQSL